MDDNNEKRQIVDIIDESMIRFIKNRDEVLENVDIRKLFPDNKSFIKAREMFAERMGVDKDLVRKIFDLLYSKDSESSLR